MAGKAEEILWYEFWKLGPDRNSNFDYLIAASFFFVCVPTPPTALEIMHRDLTTHVCRATGGPWPSSSGRISRANALACIQFRSSL